MTKQKEQLIFVRRSWEIARIETNTVTSKQQWVRRDGSFICNCGDEVEVTSLPAAPAKKGK